MKINYLFVALLFCCKFFAQNNLSLEDAVLKRWTSLKPENLKDLKWKNEEDFFSYQKSDTIIYICNYTNELLVGEAGSISVMDIYTGEIIAMNSSPSFDPNLFLYGIEKSKWNEIKKDPLKPLINKTVSEIGRAHV